MARLRKTGSCIPALPRHRHVEQGKTERSAISGFTSLPQL